MVKSIGSGPKTAWVQILPQLLLGCLMLSKLSISQLTSAVIVNQLLRDFWENEMIETCNILSIVFGWHVVSVQCKLDAILKLRSIL